AVKTADGTEIPKGTKLVGRVVGAQASTAGDTSQVAVAFDHAELAGGQNVPIQSQIQSIGSSDASSAASAGSSAMDRGAMRGSTGTDTTSPSSPSSPSAPGSPASAPSQTPGGAPSGQSPAAGSATTTSA